MYCQWSQVRHVTAVCHTVIGPELFVWCDNVRYEVLVHIFVVHNTCNWRLYSWARPRWTISKLSSISISELQNSRITTTNLKWTRRLVKSPLLFRLVVDTYICVIDSNFARRFLILRLIAISCWEYPMKRHYTLEKKIKHREWLIEEGLHQHHLSGYWCHLIRVLQLQEGSYWDGVICSE